MANRLTHLRFPRPEVNRAPLSRQVQREGGAPCSGSEDSDCVWVVFGHAGHLLKFAPQLTQNLPNLKVKTGNADDDSLPDIAK